MQIHESLLYKRGEKTEKQCKYAERHIKVGTSSKNLMWLKTDCFSIF